MGFNSGFKGLSQNRYFSFISTQFLTNKLFVSVEDFQVRTTSHIDLELSHGLFEILWRYNACSCTVVYPASSGDTFLVLSRILAWPPITYACVLLIYYVLLCTFSLPWSQAS